MVAWTGLRGAISLAAALGLPLTLSTGDPFPARSLIIFLCFVVILVTLVLQGLSLPFLIRWLGLEQHSQREQQEAHRMEIAAQIAAVHAALERLGRLPSDGLAPDLPQYLRQQYESRLRFLQARAETDEDGESLRQALWLKRELLAAERTAVLALQRRGAISDEVLARVEEDIDLEEVKYETEDLDQN